MTRVVAHRGASEEEPENTMRAFRRALELGAEGIELDVRRCRTDEVVVIHDEEVDRTTDGEGKVAEKTLDELQGLDAGKGETIPTLEQAVSAFDETFFLVELKERGLEEDAVKILRDNLPYEKFFIISFDSRSIKQVHRLDEEVRTGLVAWDLSQGMLRLCHEMGVEMVALNEEDVKQEHVERSREEGFSVAVWTVDERERAEELVEWGVDFLVTGDPPILREE